MTRGGTFVDGLARACCRTPALGWAWRRISYAELHLDHHQVPEEGPLSLALADAGRQGRRTRTAATAPTPDDRSRSPRRAARARRVQLHWSGARRDGSLGR